MKWLGLGLLVVAGAIALVTLRGRGAVPRSSRSEGALAAGPGTRRPGVDARALADPSRPVPPRFVVSEERARANRMVAFILDSIPERERKRLAALDAVAPRLGLAATQLETLKGWHRRAYALEREMYSVEVASEAERQALDRRARKLNAALWKAEQRLLQGETAWNRYRTLRDAAENGTLELVDDSGRFPPNPTAVGGTIELRHPGTPLAARDSAEFDRYFANPQ